MKYYTIGRIFRQSDKKGHITGKKVMTMNLKGRE